MFTALTTNSQNNFLYQEDQKNFYIIIYKGGYKFIQSFVVWTTYCSSHVQLPFKNFLSKNLEIYIHNPEFGLMSDCFLLLLGFASAVCFSLQLF